jgi:5-formyltetrahydrofolate cyclo-ligase
MGVRVRVHNSCMSNGRANQEAVPAVPPDKQTLRRQLRAQRRSAAPQRERSADADAIAAAAGGLLERLSLPPTGTGEHPAYDGRACVAIYRALPLEPPTQALAQMLHARNVTVIVPETLPDFDLEWRELLADGSEGPRLGLGGISAARLILTPALSVDHVGTRLGQGGGCYDRALERRRPEAVVVAIVNDEEYVDGLLPCDAHDVRVDGVITPAGGFRKIPAHGSVA